MTSRIQNRRDTAANWTSNNPTLAAGEIGFETDTNKFKIGTGSTAWNSLNYAGSDVTSTNTITLTNKTISGSSNTLTNIPNSALTNSSVTINGSAVSLGQSVTIVGESFSPFLLMGA